MARLNNKQWLEIKTRYELGEPIRQIARAFDISDGTIHAKIKNGNWNKSLSIKVAEIKEKITDIEQSAQIEQLPFIEQQILDHMAFTKSLINIDKGGLNLHGMVLKKTINKVNSGEMSEREASQIASNMGLSLDRIAARNGISKENPTTNIQINSSTPLSVNIPDDPVEAARAYQDLINNAR